MKYSILTKADLKCPPLLYSKFMIKTFLAYSAVIEALTGLALILVPARVALMLFETEITSPLEILLAMIGGVAILSLAWGAWLARSNAFALTAVKIFLLYNAAVALVILYGALELGFKGIPIWVVIVFHTYQSFVCLIIMQKNQVKSKSVKLPG
jgi:hypothetical protein